MTYDFEDRCADHERDLTAFYAAVKAKARELDDMIGKAMSEGIPCPVSGYDWIDFAPADLSICDPAAAAADAAVASAEREHEVINEPVRAA